EVHEDIPFFEDPQAILMLIGFARKLYRRLSAIILHVEVGHISIGNPFVSIRKQSVQNIGFT
ncbi:MAG: hypothetical protein PUJ43_02900, partial [Bacillales bacterium]|nr:hypothetical protein [Bacillales bacterium]MDY5919828.1 hypothetical protein [Candidatus Enteromonas sp.]